MSDVAALWAATRTLTPPILSPAVANSAACHMSRRTPQGQNGLPGFVLHGHHQGRVVVRALLSQLHDFALGIRKRRRNIRQVCTLRVILNPARSAYCKEIPRHHLRPKADRVGPILYSPVCGNNTSIVILSQQQLVGDKGNRRWTLIGISSYTV
jgi:hypothetical protein